MNASVNLEVSSVRRAVEVVSEPWTFLILRECWFGIRRFDEFQATLGIPRSTLAERLKHLVSAGLLDRVAYQDGPRRYEYRLTERGNEMYRPMAVIMHWGDRWLAGAEGPPLSALVGGDYNPLHARECGHVLASPPVRNCFCL